MLGDALRSRKTHILLVLAGCYLAWQLWLTIAAPYKIADFGNGPEKVNVLVTLPFSAGAFPRSTVPDLRRGVWGHKKTPLKFGE